MKRILINAAQPSEIRIAYVDGTKLTDFEIESPTEDSIKGNIYAGVVSAIKTDLESAFVDIGVERHGLLTFRRNATATQEQRKGEGETEKLTLDSLKLGQKLLVQVFRDPRGDKGPALTTEFSLPGRFIVLKPNSNVRTVSRNVSEASRIRLRELGNQIPKVENTGWIMRTTSAKHTQEEVNTDFHRMVNLWRNIQRAFDTNQYNAPALVYSDNTLMQRVLRDRLRRDGTTVIVDDPKLYRDARSFASDYMPELRDKIEMYRGTRPIFESFRVESDVRSTFQREVKLPSGGEVVFDPTEALLSIDVNSARNAGAENLEETALNTNIEAAHEICRQMMIRNIGGLVVVDFIDMHTEGYNEQIERVVEQCLQRDPANTASTKISELGLMQLNRQRRRSSIYDTHFVECDQCRGARYLPKIETTSNQVLRTLSYRLHDPARPENQYLCRVSPSVSAYILNKERQFLRDLEMNTHKQIVIVADPTLASNSFHFLPRRVAGLDYEGGTNMEELVKEMEKETTSRRRVPYPDEPTVEPKAMVSPLGTEPRKKKPKPKSTSKARPKQETKGKAKQTKKPKGMFQKLLSKLSLSSSQKPSKQKPKQQEPRSKSSTKGKNKKNQRTTESSKPESRRADSNRRNRPTGRQTNTEPKRATSQRTRSTDRTTRGQEQSSPSRPRQSDSRRTQNPQNRQQRNRPQNGDESDSREPQPNRRMPRANRQDTNRRPSNRQSARSQSQQSEKQSRRQFGNDESQEQMRDPTSHRPDRQRNISPQNRVSSSSKSENTDQQSKKDTQPVDEVGLSAGSRDQTATREKHAVASTSTKQIKGESTNRTEPTSIDPSPGVSNSSRYASNDPRSKKQSPRREDARPLNDSNQKVGETHDLPIKAKNEISSPPSSSTEAPMKRDSEVEPNTISDNPISTPSESQVRGDKVPPSHQTDLDFDSPAEEAKVPTEISKSDPSNSDSRFTNRDAASNTPVDSSVRAANDPRA